MTVTGDDIEARCPDCKDTTWHVVVALVDGKVASLECKQCGKRHAKKSRATGGRHVTTDEVRVLARSLFELELTRAAVAAVAKARAWRKLSDRYAGLRYDTGDALLIFEHAREPDTFSSAFAKVAKTAKRGEAFTAMHDAICEDLTAELGDPARHEQDWSLWRAKDALLFCAQMDDFLDQHGEMIVLWLVPWSDAALPDVGDDVSAWIIRTNNARR